MAVTVTLKGTPFVLAGSPLQPGQKAPQVCLVDKKTQEVYVGGATGKPQLLITVPSLDTPVCATETQKFNEAVAALGPQVQAVVVSMDLPFAQSRYCESYRVENLVVASDFRYRDMEKYGVLIAEGPLKGLLARAVFVLDPHGQITYTELVPEIAQEPDYEKALAALRALLL